MKLPVKDRLAAVLADRKAGLGSVKGICKKHGLAVSQYYAKYKAFGAKPRKVKTRRRKPAMIEMPIVPQYSSGRVWVIACNPNELQDVLRSL